MYFPNTTNGKLVRSFHRRLHQGLGQNVVMRLKEAPPDIEPSAVDARLIMLKIRHQRLIVDIPVEGTVFYWLDREIAPTEHMPKMTWGNVERGELTEENFEEVLNMVRHAFLSPVTLLPITAVPWHLGEMVDLRYFEIVAMGASSKGCRITDEHGNVVNITYDQIAQGTPSAKMTGYLDTMGKWWFWSRPSRSQGLIKKLQGVPA